MVLISADICWYVLLRAKDAAAEAADGTDGTDSAGGADGAGQ